MKTRTLAVVAILICSFLLAPGLVRADEDDWYQGQQGHWVRHGKNWKWTSTHGDEWYQGEQGHWYQDRDGWHWYGADGDEYRKGPKVLAVVQPSNARCGSPLGAHASPLSLRER